MENKFYNDNFEQLLKEAADDFRMYPSRKVWHSLYNDLHPAKRWPSLAVCLILISSVLYIGISNNNSINSIARRHANDNLFTAKLSGTGDVNKVTTHTPANQKTVGHVSSKNNTTGLLAANTSGKTKTVSSDIDHAANPTIIAKTIPAAVASPVNYPASPVVTNNESLISSNELLIPSLSLEKEKVINTEKISETSSSQSNTSPTIPELTSIRRTDKEQVNIASTNIKTANTPLKNNKADYKNNTEDLAWIENYAFHNKSFARKWKNKRSVQYYITPSIGYRHLEKNTDYEPASTLVVANPVSNNRDINDAVNQNAAINLEAGTSILFDVMKRVRLKTGIQFNYTNYISNTFELKHPTQNTILFNDMTNGNPMIVSYNTIYTNNPGSTPIKLNNKTLQLSIPVGADLKLAGKNNLKWYAGVTVQPTYVASGNVYLLSSDTKNYLEDPSLLRKWNINGGFETFISYKTSSGININVGPQFRYQFLSTYTKQYTISEKLYNIGLKMGITRNF